MRRALGGLLAVLSIAPATAQEDIGFVSEHLPEIAMDNRYSGLPLWNSCPESDGTCPVINAGYNFTHSQTLSVEGPMLAAGFSHRAGDWRFNAFLFYDALTLTGGHERRPLDVDFAAGVPYQLPAPAEFTGLDGELRDIGAGISVGRESSLPWLGNTSWRAGLLWQQLSLRNDRFEYRILQGPDAGGSGTIDYDASYRHVVPFAGIAWPRHGERWAWSPHVQLAMPLPRRGMAGHITGADFDLRGNQQDTGAGRHFGDPSITLGLDLTYLPWNLTVDLGSVASQYLLEPKIHEGVDRDLVLTVSWNGW